MSTTACSRKCAGPVIGRSGWVQEGLVERQARGLTVRDLSVWTHLLEFHYTVHTFQRGAMTLPNRCEYCWMSVFH